MRELVRPKRLVASFILALLAPGLAFALRSSIGDEFEPFVIYNTFSALIVFGFVLVITSVVYGTGVISQEVEQKTIVYLLTRPVPRWRILVIKFLAAVTGTVATVCVSAALLAAVCFVGGREIGAAPFTDEEVLAFDKLLEKMTTDADPVSALLAQRVAQVSPSALMVPPSSPMMGGGATAFLRSRFTEALNQVVKTEPLYDAEAFSGVQLRAETKALLGKAERGPLLVRLNRLLLSDALPTHFARPPTPAGQIVTDLRTIPVGALAYTSLFLFVATLLAKPLIYGLLFAFGWESWVPNMPGNFQKLSLMAYVRVLAPHPQPGTGGGDITDLFKALNPATIGAGQAWLTLVLVIFIALLAACFVFSTREFVPREDVE
jgi:ABC-type transport system involved in multi-copper enzyme maturation permease subunit